MLLLPERGRRVAEVCPSCGHTSERGVDRLVDPVSGREICVRCGAEVGLEKR